MQTNPRTTSILAAAVLRVGTLIGFISNIPSSASKGAADDPASEGLRIKPAGSLLIDATTRQSAVGALPVDFVRSPDRTGRDSSGRYLIAVNSGFGIQFNTASNPGQKFTAV